MRHLWRLGPGDRGRRLLVPFTVDDDRPIIIRLDHDPAGGTIDLGLWDPSGWRGYSGGARRVVALAPGRATPGYRRGPLPRGEWAVELGVHRVGVPELRVEVSVERTESDPADAPTGPPDRTSPPDRTGELPPVPRGSERRLPAEAGLTWYAGDFHAHSVHSDGTLTLDELARAAVGAGLDFLAVTDHNTISHQADLAAVGLRQQICLIPGQEVTTDRGHANVYGDVGWIDFHDPPDRWLAETRDRGGLMSINHPLADDCAWQWAMPELPEVLEFWHVSWYRDRQASGLTDTAMFALWARWRSDAVLLGGSDLHTPESGITPGLPTTWVAAEAATPEAILAGVAAGRTAISAGLARRAGAPPQSEPVLLPVGRALAAVAAAGLVLVDPLGQRQLITSADMTINDPAWGLWRLETPTGALRAVASVVPAVPAVPVVPVRGRPGPGH